MTEGILNKTDFKQFVATARKNDCVLYGPVVVDNDVTLALLNGNSEVVFDYTNVKLPGKRIFFPQKETLYTYEGNNAIERKIPGTQVIIFGLRPCDARALTFLDRVFAEKDYIDPYYTARRDNAYIISFACSELSDTCFCDRVGNGPLDNTGADITVYDLGDSLFFEAVSEEGKALLDAYSGLFRLPGPSETAKKGDFFKGIHRNDSGLRNSRIAEKMTTEPGIDRLVEDLAGNCLGCGVCTFLCPTCHCFVLQYETIGKIKTRVRVNDSCSFPSFTTEASGHNPRKAKTSRMRQRIMHKFSYAYKNYNELFCVGCGRCVSHCPAHIDIRELLNREK